MQLNFRDLVSLALLAAAVYFGKLEYDKTQAKPDAAPSSVSAVDGTRANFGIALAALADNLDADAKALRPVVLYSIDVQETLDKYFSRPFAVAMKSNNKADYDALAAKIASIAGPPREEITTEKRAQLVKLLRDTAAGMK